MTFKTTLATALLALATCGSTFALAQTSTAEDPKAEAQAFLNSPTSLAQATATAEAAAGGKVSGIEYEHGEDGMPDLIMADVVMPDGTEKTVSINPADGKVMKVAVEEDDQKGEGNDSEGQEGAENGTEGGTN
ncbi:MAG: hypothetical protein WAT09_04995 [Paracoccaceae bacterium]